VNGLAHGRMWQVARSLKGDKLCVKGLRALQWPRDRVLAPASPGMDSTAPATDSNVATPTRFELSGAPSPRGIG